MSVAENIRQIQASLPPQVRLIAVSKFHSADTIREAYQAGQRVFGESRVQELLEKQPVLPTDIEWDFIGSLQTNKVKFIVPFVYLIHSVDSLKLLEEINKQASLINKPVRILLEIHVAKEETKHGFTPEDCRNLLQNIKLSDFPYVQICGLMGMATYTDNREQIRDEFRTLASFFQEIKKTFFNQSDYFSHLSMGMSDDYLIAIEERSTMVRIGTRIFGERESSN